LYFPTLSSAERSLLYGVFLGRILCCTQNEHIWGVGIAQERQKMIKQDDSTDYGWKVVQEYEINHIADDSEDENLVNRALSKAERKQRSVCLNCIVNKLMNLDGFVLWNMFS
jgi:hypothetical protein